MEDLRPISRLSRRQQPARGKTCGVEKRRVTTAGIAVNYQCCCYCRSRGVQHPPQAQSQLGRVMGPFATGHAGQIVQSGPSREHHTFRRSRKGASRERGSLTRPNGAAKEVERSLVSTRKRGGGRCNLFPRFFFLCSSLMIGQHCDNKEVTTILDIRKNYC